MTLICITSHAAVRYCERVDPSITPVEAMAAIGEHMRVLEIAAAFGCSTVKLGSGVRLVLKGYHVTTVLAAYQRPFLWGAA